MEHVLLLFLILSSAKAYFISEEECLDYTIYPVQYEITIFPYIYDDRSFSYDCDMTIAFIVNVGSVTVIELDAMDMEIDENSIEVFEGGNKHNLIDAGRHFQYDKTRGKVYIYLKYPLKEYRLSKTQYLLRMKFRKFLNFDSTGVFVVRNRENGLKYMLTTRLSPNKAKYFIPCFDNPRFEAVFKFKVYIRPPPSDMITTNTSLVIAKEQKITRFKDGVVLIEYIPSPQVALHQLGFHLSDFKNRRVIAKNTNDTLIIWAPESKLHDYTYIMNFGESIINLIHDYASVNRPLVYGPINIVSVPTHMQGYEIDSWNLLTNSATRLEYKFEDTSIRQVEIMFFDLAQQLSRIWLGNPGEIERTRWKEEWFKEGVATYLAYYFLAQYKHGGEAAKQRWPLDFYGIDMRNKAMAVDWYHTVPALITFNRTLAIEIPERYKEVVTMKTASILWMVENWLGSEKFHQALVKYINTRRGKFISIDDFTANLDKDTVECLNQFFNGSTSSRVLHSWFSRAGYPVVKVQVLRDRPLNAIMLKQRQFSFTKENRQDSNYMIPISYMVENNENCFNCYRPRFTIGINSYTFEENLNDGWIILNRNASGYYRVNYDDVTWKLIAKALRTHPLSIDQLNRAQIVNDVLALYTAGDLDYYLAIEILSYLDKESSYVVWHSVISGFESLKIKNAACNMNKAVYGQWQKFMSDKVSSIYNRLMSGTEDANRLFKSDIVQFACAVKHQQCINSLKHMYRARINPDYREAVYCMMLTENREIRNDGMNDFQIEDFKLAEHKMREEERFLHIIPYGQPMPERLMLEATTPPTYHTSTPENDLQTTKNPSSSVINLSSMFSIAVTIFVACLL